MSRVVVFGLGPMRWEESRQLFALPLRSWHVARTLAERKHQILLISIRCNAYENWPIDRIATGEKDGVEVCSVSDRLVEGRSSNVRRIVDAFEPDCVVGVNRDPSAYAIPYVGNLPFWADMNGDPMAEAAAQAWSLGTDAGIAEWHRKFALVLARADHFSTCSRAQRLALIGQLGMAGRLTARNDGYEFVTAIPNSLDDDELETLAVERPMRKAHDPFVLLSTGGYNTWSDVDTLVTAVEIGMDEAPELRFVTTGGAIAGHHKKAYETFERRVAESRHRARFELAGWVPTSALSRYYARAHAAILVDRWTYEGALGARTRMLDWLAAGLPIVTTRLSEISTDLEANGAALAAECGDASAIAENILRLVRSPSLARANGERGRAFAEARCRASAQLEPLAAWVREPSRAPDGAHAAHLGRGPLQDLRSQMVFARQRYEEAGIGEVVRAAAAKAARRVRNLAP